MPCWTPLVRPYSNGWLSVGVLEQESWTLAQVPSKLQAICTKFERRAGELAPGPDSPQPATLDQGELQAHGHGELARPAHVLALSYVGGMQLSEVCQQLFSTPAKYARHHSGVSLSGCTQACSCTCPVQIGHQPLASLACCVFVVHSLTHVLAISSTLSSLQACSLAQLAALHDSQNTCHTGSQADGSEDLADDALVICNRRFHVVTAVLMLLRMLEGYAAFQECVPSHASDAARRAIELLKVGLFGDLGAGSCPP